MNFDSGTWWVVVSLIGLAMAAIGYFLKRTISKTDEHDKDINQIKQTYVTKKELGDVRAEIRDDVTQLAADVKEIKENSLTKADFYRTQAASDRKIESMEQKIDKMYMVLMQSTERGG